MPRLLVSAPLTVLCAALCPVATTSWHQSPVTGPVDDLHALRGADRVLFLGDSITYAGGYVDAIESVLALRNPNRNYAVIDAGLPSETVSGLSEPNHAGGAFDRPCLAERLDRAIEKTKPDIVVACYGMNDGIYYPFDARRYASFQAATTKLESRVSRAGARLWLLTPPPFDAVPIRERLVPSGAAPFPPGGMSADYDAVLTRYSRWLLDKRRSGWRVIDIHGPIASYVAAKRREVPSFTLAADGVHLNEVGHRLIAREVLKAWGAEAKWLPDDRGLPVAPEVDGATATAVAALVHERRAMLTDAWLSEIGHKRPQMPQGLPIADALAKAEDLTNRIRALLDRSPRAAATSPPSR